MVYALFLSVSAANNTDYHNITDLLFKVAFINYKPQSNYWKLKYRKMMADHLSHHMNITTSVTNIKRLTTKKPMAEDSKKYRFWFGTGITRSAVHIYRLIKRLHQLQQHHNKSILYHIILTIEATSTPLAHIYTWPLIFLAWYTHFNNSGGVCSIWHLICISKSAWGRRGSVRMVVGFTTTYAISKYHNWVRSSIRTPIKLIATI